MKKFKIILGYTILVSLSLAFTVLFCYRLYFGPTILTGSIILVMIVVSLWALGRYLIGDNE